MGELSEDLERCLCECSCDEAAAARARCSCEEGRVRETKRVLLGERRRLLDELHASQRGIDAIDHMLHRVSCECGARGARVPDGEDAPRAGAGDGEDADE